jgi:hypothetical protein
MRQPPRHAKDPEPVSMYGRVVTIAAITLVVIIVGFLYVIGVIG